MSSNSKHHTPPETETPLTHEARIASLEEQTIRINREAATITEKMQHLATKEDLAQMETRIQKEFHKELGNVRGEFHKELGSVKDEIAASERRILRFLTITMIGFVTIIFSALALILNYLQ